MATPLAPNASRAVLRQHEVRCDSCRLLSEYGHARRDGLLLDAWRRQIAEHLDNERQAREP